MSRLKISYDATGRKLRYDNTDYAGPFVYESGVLRYIITGEGRAIPNGSSYKYEYHIKDHLGNVRVAFINNNGTPQVVQTNNYYPFGMLMQERTDNASNKNKYLYHGKEFLPDNDLSWYDYGARMYDPQLGRWHNLDPSAEKYYSVSPNVYVSNNPLIFIDPDGKEKIIALDNNKVKDKPIISGAINYKDDNAIHIFGHGSSKGMTLIMGNKEYTIRQAEDLDAFLSEHSETWQNKEDGDVVTIVLHSCNTGKNGEDGEEFFAQKVSKSDVFKDVTIIAPNERVFYTENGEIGAYQSKTNKEGEVKRNEKGNALKSDKPGSWKVFKGGKQTGQYRGDWKPKENPTIMDNFTKKEEIK